jgi:hypothetical protein
VDAFSTRSVTRVNVRDASVTGVFTTPTATGGLSFQFSPASFLQGHDVPIHRPIPLR